MEPQGDSGESPPVVITSWTARELLKRGIEAVVLGEVNTDNLDMPEVGYYRPRPYVKEHLRREAAALGGNCVIAAYIEPNSPHGRGLAARVSDPSALPAGPSLLEWQVGGTLLVLYLGLQAWVYFTGQWWSLPISVIFVFVLLLALVLRPFRGGKRLNW